MAEPRGPESIPNGALPPPPPPPAATSPPTGAAPSKPARVIARRPGLPGGRAVVGALLVVGAGVATFALATGRDDGPSTSYAVLVHPVDPGERIDADDLTWLRMDLDDEVAETSFRAGEPIDGAIALAALGPGQLLQRGLVLAGDEASTATADQVTIPVPLERTPPALRRGERVTLLATYGSGADATTVVTVQSATVLAYESDRGSIGASSAARLTLSLSDPADVIAAAHAAQVADLTVVRTNDPSRALPGVYRRSADGAVGAVPPATSSTEPSATPWAAPDDREVQR